MNPFLTMKEPRAWGPGSFEMAEELVKQTGIQAGMRVLEVGGGSGQIAATLANHWQVSVVTLEPWTDGNAIQQVARDLGVENQVMALKLKAQDMPFAKATFDAVISIGSFEMVGDERDQALREMIRVAKQGARIGIAEPMCVTEQPPEDLPDSEVLQSFKECFRTVNWNAALFKSEGLTIAEARYYDEAYEWWCNYRDQTSFLSEEEKQLITQDRGRWLSLGIVVGEKV